MLLCLAVKLPLMACASAGARIPAPVQQEVTGFWQGQTRSGCETFMQPDPGRCNAINQVTFSIEKKNGGIGGSFRCEAGNAPCRNLADSGNLVHGEVTGRRVSLRVFIAADGSSCTYNGRLTDNAIRGGFTCTQGTAVVDSGSWEMRRPQ